MNIDCDALILGAGFGGSLLATVLSRQGLNVVIVDTSRHPRFAIGESSTPLADATLETIAKRYDLPELIPLCRYGPWKERYPQVTCGQKRGFSYFGHSAGEHPGHIQQLLVAASRSRAVADTHWLRSDVDAFLAHNALKRGARSFEGAEYSLSLNGDRWHVEGRCDGRSFSAFSSFVVDATGNAGVVSKYLESAAHTEKLQTRSSACFAHFRDVPTVSSLLQSRGVNTDNHPFPCDAAAVHHVLDCGWMWQLPFDDGTVSVGLVVDAKHGNANLSVWQKCVDRHPFLQEQFRSAKIVRPESKMKTSGRLQRLSSIAAGENWAALPSTVGFIDPLHSTGIAHNLFGVLRLAEILTTDENRTARLQRYSRQTIDELRFIDELVEGCYASLPSFRLWSAWCMIYFAAVTSMEQSTGGSNVAFLRANDLEFRDFVRAARRRLEDATKDTQPDNGGRQFEEWLRNAIQPWNNVGLLSRDDGMYFDTAAP